MTGQHWGDALIIIACLLSLTLCIIYGRSK